MTLPTPVSGRNHAPVPRAVRPGEPVNHARAATVNATVERQGIEVAVRDPVQDLSRVLRRPVDGGRVEGVNALCGPVTLDPNRGDGENSDMDHLLEFAFKGGGAVGSGHVSTRARPVRGGPCVAPWRRRRPPRPSKRRRSPPTLDLAKSLASLSLEAPEIPSAPSCSWTEFCDAVVEGAGRSFEVSVPPPEFTPRLTGHVHVMVRRPGSPAGEPWQRVPCPREAFAPTGRVAAVPRLNPRIRPAHLRRARSLRVYGLGRGVGLPRELWDLPVLERLLIADTDLRGAARWVRSVPALKHVTLVNCEGAARFASALESVCGAEVVLANCAGVAVAAPCK